MAKVPNSQYQKQRCYWGWASYPPLESLREILEGRCKWGGKLVGKRKWEREIEGKVKGKGKKWGKEKG